MTRPTLLYVHDPLCGWCYGFAPVMHQLRREFSEHIQFELLCGGMVTGARVGPARAMASYIRSATPRLVEMTGAPITEAFLTDYLDSEAISDSEPPSRAIVAAGMLGGESLIWDYAYALQQALFQDGQDLRVTDTYRTLAHQFSLDSELFLETMRSDAVRERTQHEFDVSRQMQIGGFPALILLRDETAYHFSSGYQSIEKLRPNLEQLAQNAVSGRWP